MAIIKYIISEETKVNNKSVGGGRSVKIVRLSNVKSYARFER